MGVYVVKEHRYKDSREAEGTLNQRWLCCCRLCGSFKCSYLSGEDADLIVIKTSALSLQEVIYAEALNLSGRNAQTLHIGC